MTGTRPHKPRSAAAIAFYTQCRHWHGYLSAFAFLALIFFSASGILLNHPEWLGDTDAAAPQLFSAPLPIDGIAAARRAKEAGPALAALAAAHLPVVGAYSSADVDSRQAFLRYEGVKGSSDVSVDFRTGAASARVRRADALTVMDDLHRGKNVGKVWQWVIDLSGAVFLLLSLVGYVLFFTLRFRLRVALVLTALSLGTLALIFVFFVP
jgi:hypothetical protein